jgi:hypothetical protein
MPAGVLLAVVLAVQDDARLDLQTRRSVDIDLDSLLGITNSSDSTWSAVRLFGVWLENAAQLRSHCGGVTPGEGRNFNDATPQQTRPSGRCEMCKRSPPSERLATLRCYITSWKMYTLFLCDWDCTASEGSICGYRPTASAPRRCSLRNAKPTHHANGTRRHARDDMPRCRLAGGNHPGNLSY